MNIIEIQTLSNGAHRNQNGGLSICPDGYAVIPDDMEIPNTFPFVDITVEEIDGVQTVTSMTAGIVPEPEPQPEPEPSQEEDTASMLIDHEYRLTLLELGLSE